MSQPIISTRLQNRIESLQTGNHTQLRLLRVVAGTSFSEAWLHRRYKKRRLKGEWFEFDEEMLTIIPPLFESDYLPEPRKLDMNIDLELIDKILTEMREKETKRETSQSNESV